MTFDEEKKKEIKEMALDIFGVYLMQKLEDMQTEKAERLKNVEPHYVTKKEIYDAIIVDAKSILNKMFHENKVKVHKTIHAPIHDYVELVKED
jgi:hypothetical protein